MDQGERYAGGLSLQFFDGHDFENENPTDPQVNASIVARNVLRVLMMGWRSDWQKIISKRVLKAVLYERDKGFMQGLRLVFQQGFSHVYDQLRQTQNLTEHQLRQAQLYISNCLTLLPFGDLNPFESIAIPQWVNNEWRLVDYKVVPIELTSTNRFKKLFIRDEDRVFAYGLEPLRDTQAEPHLIFMGTTYPAGQGFIDQVDTDMDGFGTVGNKLYRSGRERLSNWIKAQGRKIHVCGTSLGASLSLLLAIDQGEQLSRVDALNPAGLSDSWFSNHIDNWEQLSEKPPVFIQKQGDDPVSKFGVWKSDWNILHVIPPADKRGPNGFADHALNYASFAETEFLGVNADADNEEHRRRNFWLYNVGRGVVSSILLLPYRYLIRPFLHYLLTHKTQLALIVGFSLLFGALFIAFPWIIGAAANLYLNAMLAGIGLGYILDNVIWFGWGLYNEGMLYEFQSQDGARKYPETFLYVYLALGLTICVGLSMMMVFLLSSGLLLVIPGALFTCSSIILLIPQLSSQIAEAFHIVWDNSNVAPATCHDPMKILRSPPLDIYTNELETSFSASEIRDYYFAKRVMLNKKDLIPQSNYKTHVQFEGKSKREILENNDAPDMQIKIKASKAKIYDMKRTVQLIQRFGIYTSDSHLADALINNDEEYRQGKKTLSFEV